ncbi:hypothetical protein [Arthrobacter sp. CAN_A1]|uniref:hypothetical protein n=1 Tax=Arthrobacter sp. CAN_A1 TaxID=2787717 RepID=UPI0018CB3148
MFTVPVAVRDGGNGSDSARAQTIRADKDRTRGVSDCTFEIFDTVLVLRQPP